MNLNRLALLSFLAIAAAATLEPIALPAPPEGTYPDEVLMDRPVAYWRLGETSGATARDLSGNGNDTSYHDGVTLGLPGLLSGDSDPAVGVGGPNNGYIQNNRSFLTTTAGITVEVWFVAQALTSDTNNTLFVSGLTSGTVGYHWLYLRPADTGNSLCWNYANGTTGSTRCIPFAPLVGKRYHLVVTHDYAAKQINFYINGKLYPHATITHPDGVVPLSGQWVKLGTYDGRYSFTGVLDEVALYTEVLSASRILAHSTAGGSANSSDIYVAPPPLGNNEQNDGSPGRPLATIRYAADAVLPGATVHVAPGIYSEAPVTYISGAPGAPIRFVSDTKWAAQIRSSGVNSVWTNNGKYVTIEGFDISGTNFPVNPWIYGIVTAPYARVIGNHIHNIGEGFCASGGGAGIAGDQHVDSIGNIVDHIGLMSPPCIGVHGIYYSDVGGQIQNNIVYLTSGWGIHLWHNPRNIVVANNLVFQNQHGGIVVGGDASEGGMADGVLVSNNIAIDNGGAGPGYGWGIVEEGSLGPNNQYINNLVYANTVGGIDRISGYVVGTLTEDPRLVDYEPDGTGDYHLAVGSICIGNGAPDGAPPFDFDGIPRPQGGHYSIGPYEKRPSGSLLVQGSGLTNFVQGASASLAYGSNNAAGNTLVAMVRVTNPSGAITISDTQGNAWTSRQQVTNGTSTMVWFDAIGANAGYNTVRVSQSSSTAYLELCIAEYSNVTAFDQQASTTGSGSTGTTPSINLATGNELVIGWFSNEIQNSLSFTAGSGFTLRNNSAGNVVFEDKVVSGSLSASMGFSASVSWFAGILAYQTNLPTSGP